jgi:O-antigen/teichoic acid export membrane protein
MADPRRRLGRVLIRWRAHTSEPLFSGAYNLMVTTLVTAVLGIGFWAGAARLYPASVVGRDAVLIAMMMTLSSACQLNLVDAFVRFLPVVAPRRRPATIAAGYAASAVAATVAGIAFVLVAPLASRPLRFLSRDPALAASFVAALVLWGIFVIQDGVLTSLRRTRWLPIENSAFSLAKIALVPALVAVGSGHGVFLAWVAPTAVIVAVVNWLLFTRVLRPALGAHDVAPAPITLARSRLARFLAQDYAGYLLTQAPYTVLPLVVISHLGSRANAYFAIPLSLVGALDVLFYSVTTSLTVEAAHDASRTAELARTIVRRFLAVQVPLAAMVALCAPLILLPFGSAYASHGATALRLLACASVFRTFGYLFNGLSRLHVRGTAIMLAQGGLASISVVLAFLLVHPLGLAGVALAWLIANFVVAVGAAPSLWRYLRSEPVTGPLPAEALPPGPPRR